MRGANQKPLDRLSALREDDSEAGWCLRGAEPSENWRWSRGGCDASRDQCRGIGRPQESRGRGQDPNGKVRVGVQPTNRIRGNGGEFGLVARPFFQCRGGCFSPGWSLDDGLAMHGESLGELRFVWILGLFAMRSAPVEIGEKVCNITKINAMRKQRKGKACREPTQKRGNYSGTRAEKKTPVGTKNAGPAEERLQGTIFDPRWRRSFSAPTHLAGRGRLRRFSLDFAGLGVGARDRGWTSRVRPTSPRS